MIAVAVLATLASFGLSLLAWGDWEGFFAHPARLGVCVVILLLLLAMLSSGANLSSGRREDTRNRWIFLPSALYAVALACVPPFTDSRNIWALDGDTVRWAGLALFAAGGLLRVAPMFVLGRRFSGLVAVQERHELVTDGLYGVIRHPSYLGGIVAGVGWTLVFRSLVGLLLMPLAIWLTIARIDAEEAFLESEFQDAYATYRRRTWRLVPWLY